MNHNGSAGAMVAIGEDFLKISTKQKADVYQVLR